MSKPTPWSLGGQPPEPAHMPVLTPEEQAAVTEAVAAFNAKTEEARQRVVDKALADHRAKVAKTDK